MEVVYVINGNAGNKGLCGKPVNSDCAIQSPPPPPLKSPPPPGIIGDVESSILSAITGILMLTAICLLAVALIIALYLICRGDRGRYHYRLHRGGGSFDPLYSPNNNPTASPSPDRASTPSSSAGAGASPSVGRLAFVRADRTQFSLQDLLRASAEVLGAGNLGSSYKAVLMGGEAVVVKRFKHMNQVGREEFQEHMRRLAGLQHPNLLPLVAYYYRKEEKLLISDFVPNANLATHLYGKDSSLDWSSRLKIIKGVAKGMLYLHKELTSLVLPHGHLKPSNILLDHSFNPILMDYAMVPILNPGEARNLLAAYKSPVCTANLGHPTRKTDVWTLGILILETLTGTSPDSHLQTWINSISKAAAEGNDESHWEIVFDAKIQGNLRESGGQMRELLKIGVVCCREDLDYRWDLNEAVERIQNLKEMDNM
ncbi:unnamed protein product [Cuscuta campestris]|uniref:Protein kinase domain-containing protein n=1 Tax=Cuscuta campestris TaxID=132261 RepID=A0A484KXL8_9ASTE|nr:unnamed protein product [Cuscuta campestris]